MEYRESVDLAAVALARGEDANWELARLTFENTWTLGESRDGRVSMEQWCSDLLRVSGRKFKAAVGVRYKRIWRRHGTRSSEERVPWLEAYEEDTGAPLSVLRETYGAAPTVTPEPTPREQDRAYNALADEVYAAPAEHREYLFRRLAQDDEIIGKAAEVGSPVSRAVSGLESRAEQIRERKHEQAIQADPVSRRHDQRQAADELASLTDRFARDAERYAEQVTALLRRSGDVSEERRFWIKQATDRLRAVLDLLERYAETGQSELDAFLGDVLAGRRDG